MEQMTLEDFLSEKYKITNKIKLIELFAGYGSQALALEYLGVPFEHHLVCEFDKYAMQSYNELHNTNFNTTDIRQLKGEDLNIKEKNKYTYLLTYSFPCTDLSIAGKQKGMKRDSKTRSGLLWEVERLLNETEELPQVLLMENVKDLCGKFINDFNEWLIYLEGKGYKNTYKILNAKDYGIPQNRERCFMVSILGDYNYKFPKGMPLELILKDMLEDNVEDKYFISDKISLKFKNDLENKDNKLLQVGTLDIKGNDCIRRVYDPNGISPTLTTMAGGNRQPKIIINEPICLNSKGGRAGKPGIQPSVQDRVYSSNGISTALTTSFMPKIKHNNLVRKLTPRECFRLMGVKDQDFNKLTCSNSQLYKQAGNSIVVNVLMAIFSQLL